MIHNWKVESARLRPAERKWAGPAHLESGQIISIDQMKWAQADAAESELLPILRWALTYITKTSKHNFRGLVLRLFLQLSSCVFLSLPVSHNSGGIPPPPPPPLPSTPLQQCLKAAFVLPKLMKKWLNEECFSALAAAGRRLRPCGRCCWTPLSVCASEHISESPAVAISRWSQSCYIWYHIQHVCIPSLL